MRSWPSLLEFPSIVAVLSADPNLPPLPDHDFLDVGHNLLRRRHHVSHIFDSSYRSDVVTRSRWLLATVVRAKRKRGKSTNSP